MNLHEILSDIKIDPNEYRLVHDDNGLPNLCIKQDTVWVYLYANNNAADDARNWARENYSETDQIVIWGAGFGLHISAMTDMLKEHQHIHVFEPNLQILKIAFEQSDLEKLITRDNISFYAGDMNYLINEFYKCLSVSPAVFCSFFHTCKRPDILEKIAYPFTTENIKRYFTPPVISETDICRNFGFSPSKPQKIYKIILLGFYNLNYEIRSFLDNLKISFSILGHDAVYIAHNDLYPADGNVNDSVIDSLISCDFVICCNCSGVNAYLCDDAMITFISLNIDRPYHLFQSIGNEIKNIIYTWNDRDDVLIAKKYYHKHGKHSLLAHGAEMNLDITDVFSSERWLDIVVSCNYDELSLDKLKNFPEDMVTKIIEIYRNGGVSWESAVKEVTESDDAVFEFMSKVGFELDSSERYFKKKAVINALLDSGLTVHCFGRGWDKTDLVNKTGFIYHNFVGWEPMRQILKHTKILVNILPIYFNGSHERVYSSMIRGALCITDYSEILSEQFREGEDLLFYKDLSDLPQIVKYYLANDAKRIEITKNAFAKTKANHTWLHRAKELIDIFEKNQPN